MGDTRHDVSRSVLGAVAVLGLVGVIGFPSAIPAAAADTGSSISGTVTLPPNAPAEWLGAVNVSASPVAGGGAGGSVLVDPTTGRYSISGLATGSYRVQFSPFGAGQPSPSGTDLLSEYFDNTHDYSRAVPVAVSPQSPATGIDATLEASASISGTVTLPADAPADWLTAVTVFASPVTGSGFGGSARIDPATGQYVINGLEPGSYRVQFSASNAPPTATNLVSEYFGNTPDYALAVEVATSPDSPATGIDAALEAGSSISGTVTLPPTAPSNWFDAVTVFASPTDGGGWGGASTVDPATGGYVINGLVAGSYRVQFSTSSTAPSGPATNLLSEYFEDTRDYNQAVPVETSPAAPATDIDATLESSSTISGAVSNSNGAPLQNIAVSLVDAADPTRGVGWAQTDASGAYRMSQVPTGRYKIFVGASDNLGYVRTYLGGSSFASATTLDVTGGTDVPGQNVALAPRATNTGAPAMPNLSVGAASDGTPRVTWTAPTSTAPVLAYNVVWTTGFNGDGLFQLAAPTNSTDWSTQGVSRLLAVSALTASSEGAARAVVVNDPASPAKPVVNVTRNGSSITVSAGSSAPDGAQWWFAVLPTGAGAMSLVQQNPTGTSATFPDTAPQAEIQVFGGWSLSSGTWSQIASKTGGQAPLTAHPWFAAKYAELGGASGPLGAPLKAMVCQSSSCWQEFAGGVLTSDGRQIVKLSTAYVTTWLANGGPDGALGIVAGPESCFGTYCATPFTHGVIKWIPGGGVTAIVVNAWFEAKWKALGGLTAPIGAPSSAMQCQASACWQEFTGGVLTSDGRQIVQLSSAYVSTWLAWGGPGGDLGLVAGAESCFGTYCQTPFAGGVVVWVPGSGVFPVAKAWFYNAWMSRGGATGSLGLPTDAMKCQAAACYQSFQKGTLTSSTSGIEALSSAYVASWAAGGGPGGPLGLLTGPEACFGSYCQVPFQRGLMVWEPGSNVRTLTGSQVTQWNAAHSPGDTKNCGDFATHADAQAWFDRYYPIYGDIARLDFDNNRIACEDLP